MLLIIILGIIALMLVGFVVLVVGAGGAIFILIFADVIVCIIFIVWLIKKIFKRKH